MKPHDTLLLNNLKQFSVTLTCIVRWHLKTTSISTTQSRARPFLPLYRSLSGWRWWRCCTCKCTSLLSDRTGRQEETLQTPISHISTWKPAQGTKNMFVLHCSVPQSEFSLEQLGSQRSGSTTEQSPTQHTETDICTWCHSNSFELKSGYFSTGINLTTQQEKNENDMFPAEEIQRPSHDDLALNLNT